MKIRNGIFESFKRRALLLGEAAVDGGAGGGGGGAAVAEAPASTSGDVSGGGRTGGNDGGGFFFNLPQKDLKAAAENNTEVPAKTDTAKVEGGNKFVVNDDSGKPLAEFATEAEAQAYVEANKGKSEEIGKTETKTEIEITPDTVLKVPIYKRFSTIKAAEEGLQRSEQEGIRLASEVKQLRADKEKALATREAELASLRAEIEIVRKTPPFQELTEEQLEALAKDSPLKASRYLLAKDKHEQGIQKAKDDAARHSESRRQKFEAANAEIQQRDLEMRADKKAYPMFEDLNPKMNEIHEKTGGDNSPLRGQVWANELYYLASLGMTYRDLLKNGDNAKTDATAKAKATAEATAKGTAGVATGTVVVKAPAKDAEHEAWSKSIKDAGPKKFLTFGE